MKRKIAIADTEHGALSARHSGKDGQWALPGTFIEIDWQPNAGWGLSEAHYVAGGTETPINLGVKGFVMPDADVVIGGTFKRFIVQDWTTNDKESSGKVLGIDENGNITPVEGGGGGGTTDYNDLENKPKINGQELVGNRLLPTYNDFVMEFFDEPNKAVSVKGLFAHFRMKILTLQEMEDFFGEQSVLPQIFEECVMSLSFAGERYLKFGFVLKISASAESLYFDLDMSMVYDFIEDTQIMVIRHDTSRPSIGFNASVANVDDISHKHIPFVSNLFEGSIQISGLVPPPSKGLYVVRYECFIPITYI